MDGRKTRDALQELAALHEILAKDGQIAPALQIRYEQLVQFAAEMAEAVPIKTSPDTTSTLELLNTHSWNSCPAKCFSSLTETQSILCILAVIVSLICQFIGVSYVSTYPLQDIVYLINGPTLLSILLWGIIYPSWLLHLRHQMLYSTFTIVHPEGRMFVLSNCATCLLLIKTAPQQHLLILSVVHSISIAVLALSILAPIFYRQNKDLLLRKLLLIATNSLKAGHANTSRFALEVMLSILSTEEKQDEQLAFNIKKQLKIAILLEAEQLRLSGRHLSARALLEQYHVRPEDALNIEIIDSWARYISVPKAKLYEATGLYIPAGLYYQQLNQDQHAKRCYEFALSRTNEPEKRASIIEKIISMNIEIGTPLALDLVDIVTHAGRSIPEATVALSKLSVTQLIKPQVTDRFEQILNQFPPERTINILEDILGLRKPRQLPELFRILAQNYRAMGHKSTAKRIESELQLPNSQFDHKPNTSEVLIQNNHPANFVGRIIINRYKLLRSLGAGSMGEVFLAKDTLLDRHVAVKFLHAQMRSELLVRKFKEEAKLVAGLEHPGIVRVFDAGETETLVFYVMELVDGPDLASHLKKHPKLPLQDRLAWFIDVADAMSYAHHHGVIHRDIKPENILVGTDGAKITDFGVAHIETEDETGFGAAGISVGTPLYMAPELIAQSSLVSNVSDIYSLGTTLYQVLTHRLPFQEHELYGIKLFEPPKPIQSYLPNLSNELNQVVTRSLAVQPQERYQSMEDFAKDLKMVPEVFEGETLAMVGRKSAI